MGWGGKRTLRVINSTGIINLILCTFNLGYRTTDKPTPVRFRHLGKRDDTFSSSSSVFHGIVRVVCVDLGGGYGEGGG